MSRKVSLPKIDPRKAEHLLRQLHRMAPHYTREWPAKDDDDPGVALLKIFSFIAEGVINRLNRAPDRNFLAFLDMLGIRLLPATPARVPVRFLLANGTEEPFLVPQGAQVTAAANAERQTEMPFETMKDLWAIPAKLTDLIAVDPEKDCIYKPYATFLEIEKVEPELPLLEVTAFSSKDSKFLQLQPPDQVKKDDFLRIDHASSDSTTSTGCPPPATNSGELGAADHLVVLDAKGSIVTVTDPLPRDYVEGTKVKRVTDFELFEARNWQEHVLFLGHAEYFAMKTEAQIELEVEQAGAVANLESLDVIWEFFGDAETSKEDEWRRFKVDSDGTLGFSRSGIIILNKPVGEIKEKEINGKKSRWIRARLDGPLPADPGRLLPTIESIYFKVSSSGVGIAADQAFHNDNPLTMAAPFLPFGTEPRIFDRFSIASEEAFSKPGAGITLHFDMDQTELLGTPAIVIAKTKVHAFATALAGRLLEFQIDPTVSDSSPEKHGSPTGTRITASSIPAAVTDALENRIGVFVKADDGKIWLRSIPNATTADWFPLLITPGQLQFDPAAILASDGFWHVYVVADNQLYKQILNPAGLTFSNTWTPIEDVPNIGSTPFLLDMGDRVVAFVVDVKGVTWLFDPSLPSPSWVSLTPTIAGQPDSNYLAYKNKNPGANKTENTDARPFAYSYALGTQFTVFLRGASGKLIILDTLLADQILDGPPTAAIDSNPFVLQTPAGDQVFVKGADGRLWSLDITSNHWTEHGRPSGLNLKGDPFVLEYPKGGNDFVSVFLRGDKNSLLEFRKRGKDLNSGFLKAGPLDIVVVQDKPTSSLPLYLHMKDGPNAGFVREFDSALSKDEFVVLKQSLVKLEIPDTSCEILNEIKTGKVKNPTSTTLDMQPGHSTLVANGDYVFVAGQLRPVGTASVSGDTVTVAQWDTDPTTADDYFLLRPEVTTQPNKVIGKSARLVRLDTSASTTSDPYTSRFLEITLGPGASPGGRFIQKYFKDTQHVELKDDFDQQDLPKQILSRYSVTVSSAAEAWFVYKDPDQSDIRPELSWEYFNGRGWVALRVIDATDRFLVTNDVTFNIPQDMAKTEVAGQENFWVRARIIGGDYGQQLFTFDEVKKTVKIEKDPIRPPKITKLTIAYQLTEQQPPQVCLTFNNLNYLDQTAANVTEDKHFKPYLTLEDAGKSVYFGFDRGFEKGPVRIYFAAKELEVDENNKPTLTWEFASDNMWKTLTAEDETKAFTRPDFVSLTVPLGFETRQKFGKAQYWLRATLSKGDWKASPLFKGVFLNTVEALQARTVQNEILGSSTAVKNQKFRFQQVPVLEREEVRVLEFFTEAEREELLRQEGKDRVRAITDQRGDLMQTWIKWTEVIEFFDSKPDSRHYRLDRQTGEIEFGDGVHGRIPPAGGDSIQAFTYQTGGGAAGNVAAGEIKSAVTAVAGVDSVINPVASGGGSEPATNEEMMEIGPAQISHRDRAVTPQDFERLAHEASREVRKALCLPNRNAGGRHELGWTSVHIVPASKAAEPKPSLELRRAVRRYLADRADVTLVDQDHIFVGPPRYVPVSVEVKVAAKSIDVVATAEQSVRQKLDEFLHPLTGGPAKEGWDFGRDLAASDLYTLLEDIDDVDHVETLRMVVGDTSSEERVEVEADALLAGGTHEIDMIVATENT